MPELAYAISPTDLADDEWLCTTVAEVGRVSIIGRVALVARTMEATAAHLGVPLDGALAAEIDNLWQFVEKGGWPANDPPWETNPTDTWAVESWFGDRGALPVPLESIPVPLLRMLVWGGNTALAHAYGAITGVGEESQHYVALSLQQASLTGAQPPNPLAFAAVSPFAQRDEPGAFWREWGRPISRSAFPTP